MKVLDLIKKDVLAIMDNDPAHDFEHVMRVYHNAQKIVKKEKANLKLVLSAALLHDIVSYPKSSKRSKLSSIDSAKKSKLILKKYDFTVEEITVVSDAIKEHSFSQNKIPACKYLLKRKIYFLFMSKVLCFRVTTKDHF